jgi:hypothetical protein
VSQLKPNFKCQPSQYLLGILITLYTLPMLAVWFVALPWWIALGINLLLAWHAYYLIQRYALLNLPNSIGKVMWQDGHWQLTTRQNKAYYASLLDDSISTPFLILLNFRELDTRKKHAVIIFPDSLAQNTLRELRVFLRACR